MALQFYHVFTGEGVGAREKDQQAFIDYFTLFIMETTEVRLARLQR